MPLIILTGYPLSGKTRFAETLKERLLEQFDDIQIINDELLGIDKATGYVGASEEKRSRAALLAAVERHISQNRLVIADSTNEIKGFRYQLYCLARAVSTPHACVQLVSSEHACTSRNHVYPERVIKDMLTRYEEPNGQSRWDSPLFHVLPDSSFMHFAELAVALKGTPAKQPSLATRKTEVPADYVQSLEEACRLVIETVSRSQTMSMASFTHKQIPVSLPGKLSPAKLQRLKRQFIQMQRQTACPVHEIERLFIDYLNKAIIN